MRRDSDPGRCPSPSLHRSQYPPHYPTWGLVQGRLPVYSHSRHTKVYAHKVTDPHTARHTDTWPHRQTGTLHMLIHIWTGLLEHTHSQSTYTDTEKHVFTQKDGHIHSNGTCPPDIHTHAGTHIEIQTCFYIHRHTQKDPLSPGSHGQAHSDTVPLHTYINTHPPSHMHRQAHFNVCMDSLRQAHVCT